MGKCLMEGKLHTHTLKRKGTGESNIPQSTAEKLRKPKSSAIGSRPGNPQRNPCPALALTQERGCQSTHPNNPEVSSTRLTLKPSSVTVGTAGRRHYCWR